MNFIAVLVMLFICVNCSGQKTFEINKAGTDSIQLESYKIFSVSKDIDINFIGKQIPQSKRFTPTKEDAIIADQIFKEQYVRANTDQYYKQFHDPNRYHSNNQPEKSEKIYQNTNNRIESKAKKDLRRKLKKYDRYFFGYRNLDNEKLILMRFDPHKIKFYSLPGTGESHIDVLTIYVLNMDKKKLSMSGWADFNED